VWRTYEPAPERGLEEDVRCVADLIDALGKTYGIDRSRVYVNGFSNGGAMASVLACALSDRIAAVGTVAPALDTPPPSWFESCRPMPLIQFHGTADPFVTYEGDPSSARSFPAVSAWASSWARRNGCAPDPIESEAAADVSRREYRDCTDDATVVLYTVRGGHNWPGGRPLPEWWAGPTSRAVYATSETWRFFREHPLARP
jgi:polyhydroxybutyrate depolymerase